MSSVAHTTHQAPTGFIRKYIFSLDHKVIGIQYYFLALFSVFLGMFLSLMMRYHMVFPAPEVLLVVELRSRRPAGSLVARVLLRPHVRKCGGRVVGCELPTAPPRGPGACMH